MSTPKKNAEKERLTTDLQRAHEQQAATRQILDSISQSRDDEQPVFDLIVKMAKELCNATFAGLVLGQEGDEFQRVLASENLSAEILQLWEDGKYTMQRGASFAADSILDREVISIEDMGATRFHAGGDERYRIIVTKGGIRSNLIVPLVLNDQGIGCLMLGRDEVRPYTSDQVQLIETLAAQAVIAIENVRQFREVQERLEREEASREILEVISLNPDNEQPVFDAIINRAAKLCRAPHAGLLLRDADDQHLVLVAVNAEQSGYADYLRENPHSIDDETSLTVEAVRAMEVRQYPDIEALAGGTAISDQLKNTWQLERMRTLLYVPLIKGDRAIGTLGLYRLHVEEFSDDDIEILKLFAAQAVIAIENVRQFRELQTRLEREKATGDVLSVISRSRDDEAPVFRAIHESASRLCDAPFSGLFLVDASGENLRLASHFGGKEDYVDNPMIVWPLSDPSAVVRAVTRSEIIHIHDLAETKPYRDGHDPTVRAVDIEGTRTFLAVPLMRDGEAIGSIALYRVEVRPFTDDQIDLIRTFAAQAVIAIENVRQFREVQTRLDRETASKDVLRVISTNREDELPVFDAILENAAVLCRSPMARLHLVDEKRENHRMVATWGEELFDIQVGESWSLEIDKPVEQALPVARALRERKTVLVDNLRQHPFYTKGHALITRMVDVEDLHAYCVVPLVEGESAIGCITLSRRLEGAFSADEIALVETFATQAVIAIENVRQFREVQTRLEREAASREILQVISASRTDPAPVFDVILKHATQLSGAPLANLALLDEQRGHWHLVAHFGDGLRHLKVGETATPLDSKLVPAVAMRTASVVHIENLMETDLYRQGDPGRVAMVEVEGMRTIVGVPLLSESVAIGSITLFRREVKAFSNEEILLVETFAAQAVIAIENVKQYRALADRTAEVEALNLSLESRVEDQVGEIERMGRLKRFLPSAVADAVVTTGDESMLSSHRALIATLFCDMRGFTAFCEAAEPEETIEVLQTYHHEMSELIDQFGAGVDQRAGDGIMVIFNDPIAVDDPAGDAVRLALAMRETMRELCAQWKKLGHRLGFGIGISFGYATVGMVGSAGRFDYTASGTSVNTAARLCDMAQNDEILISPRAWAAVEGDVEAESRGEVEMKGIREPVEIFSVIAE